MLSVKSSDVGANSSCISTNGFKVNRSEYNSNKQKTGKSDKKQLAKVVKKNQNRSSSKDKRPPLDGEK